MFWGSEVKPRSNKKLWEKLANLQAVRLSCNFSGFLWKASPSQRNVFLLIKQLNTDL